MKIEIDLEKEDLKWVIQGIQSILPQLQEDTSKDKLKRVAAQFQTAFWLEETAFTLIYNLLDPYTSANITLYSDLMNGLSLDPYWVDFYLPGGCDKVVLKLLELSGSVEKPAKITSAQVKKCVIVKDLVDLVTKTYEKAQ